MSDDKSFSVGVVSNPENYEPVVDVEHNMDNAPRFLLLSVEGLGDKEVHKTSVVTVNVLTTESADHPDMVALVMGHPTFCQYSPLTAERAESLGTSLLKAAAILRDRRPPPVN